MGPMVILETGPILHVCVFVCVIVNRGGVHSRELNNSNLSVSALINTYCHNSYSLHCTNEELRSF